MKRGTEQRWAVVRQAYMGQGDETLKALARKHGVSYPALLRRIREHGWEQARALPRARQELERAEQVLPWARMQAILAARRIIEVCRDQSLDLRTLHYETREAASVINAHGCAALLARARHEVRELEAGRMPEPCYDPFPNDPRWGRPGSWYNSLDFHEAGPGASAPPLGQRPGKPGHNAERGEGISARRIKRYLTRRARRGDEAVPRALRARQ